MKRWLFVAWLATHAFAQTPEQLFEQANALAAKHQYQEALPLYQKLLQEAPTANVLWNLGITAQFCQNWPVALDAWSQLRKLEPDNWKVRAKLIQVYQASNQKELRDQERAALLDFRKAHPPLVKENAFCRDQFEVADNHVLVYEMFDFTGPRKVRYQFSVMDPATDQRKYILSLGSYDETTQIAREVGSLGPDQRLFHLDQYQGNSHSTYAMVEGEPDYDTVRQWVVDVLSGKRKPATSSGPKVGP